MNCKDWKNSNASGSRKSLQTLQPSSTPGQLVGGSGTNVQKKVKRKRDAIGEGEENPQHNNKQLKVEPLVKSQSISKDIVIYSDPVSRAKPEAVTCKECVKRQESQVVKAVQTDVSGATGVNKEGCETTDAGKSAESEPCKSVEDVDQEAFELMGQEEVPEMYWKDLAEQRRAALEESLIENETLHNEVGDLREENESLHEENKNLQTMADQAEILAEAIKEMTDADKSWNQDSSESETPGSACQSDDEAEIQITSPHQTTPPDTAEANT